MTVLLLPILGKTSQRITRYKGLYNQCSRGKQYIAFHTSLTTSEAEVKPKISYPVVRRLRNEIYSSTCEWCIVWRFVPRTTYFSRNELYFHVSAQCTRMLIFCNLSCVEKTNMIFKAMWIGSSKHEKTTTKYWNFTAWKTPLKYLGRTCRVTQTRTTMPTSSARFVKRKLKLMKTNGGLPFLLKCHYNLDNNLPLFYHKLLDYFQELTKFSEYDKNNDLILSNNRRITIERNSVFWKQWFDQGVTFISDLMNSNGKFLTFEEFQNKFEIKANYLHYFQLIAAIPPDLKRKAFGSTVPDLLGATSEYCQVEDKIIVLTKFRCKHYYSLFIEKLVSGPCAVRAWKKSFSELPDWADCFVNIYKSSKIISLDNSLLRLCTE